MEKGNIGYIRVSTEEQAKEKNSLINQRREIIKYFEREGITDYYILEDDGYSAKDENRPNYQSLLFILKNNGLNQIVCHKIDRLNRDVIDYNNLMNRCREKGVKLVSIMDSINLDSAVGRGTSNIQMAMAQMEREQISERTKAGYVGALIQGKYPISTLTLGFTRDKNKRLRHNSDIEIVKEIFNLFYEQNKTAKEITIIMKKEYFYLCKWTKEKIYRIIDNTLYRGYKVYEGESYEVVKPIVNYPIREKTTPIKKVVEIHNYNYIFRDLIYYKGEKLYGSTTIKNRNKINEKYYRYYLNKDRSIKISEDKLVNAIRSKIVVKNEQLEKLKEERKKNLDELYIEGNLTKHEYIVHSQKLKNNCYNIDIESITKIEVLNNNEVLVKTRKGKDFIVTCKC